MNERLAGVQKLYIEGHSSYLLNYTERTLLNGSHAGIDPLPVLVHLVKKCAVVKRVDIGVGFAHHVENRAIILSPHFEPLFLIPGFFLELGS